MYTGPHIVTEGLFRGYDDDPKGRFYDGEPTTNLLYWSQDFSNAAWNNSALITNTGYLAPDGTYTAQKASNPAKDAMLYKSGGSVTGQRKSIYARTVSGEGTTYVCGYRGLPQYLANLTEEWQRFDADTLSTETGGTHFYAIDFRQGTLSEAIIWGAQKEDKTHVTTYVMSDATLGTRVNASVLHDLTGVYAFNPGPNMEYDQNQNLWYPGTAYMEAGLGSEYWPMPDFTVEAIIKSSAMGPGQSVGGIYCVTYGLRMNLRSDGRIQVSCDDGASLPALYSSGVNCLDDKYHHLVWTQTDGDTKLYVDGIVRINGALAWDGTARWTNNARIGTDINNTSVNSFYGNIRVAKMYKKVLSPQEVANNFNAYKQRFDI